MNDWENCEAVERTPDKMRGAWLFRGTRVPASALFENLWDGTNITSSWCGFPV